MGALGSFLNPTDASVPSDLRGYAESTIIVVNARDGICRGKPLPISYYHCRRRCYKGSGEVAPNPMSRKATSYYRHLERGKGD